MYKIITDCDDCYKGREGCAQERVGTYFGYGKQSEAFKRGSIYSRSKQ